MEKPKAILVYVDIRKNLELLSDNEAGKVFKALIKYGDEGTLPQFEDRAITVFVNSIVDQIERDRKKYAERCEKARRSQQIRWEKQREDTTHTDTNVYSRNESYTFDTNNNTDTNNITDTDNNTETIKDNEKRENYRENASGSSLSDNFIKWYNGQIQYTELPKISKMTAKREKALKDIIGEFGKEDIALVMSKIINSNYLCGNTSKRFKATFDWVFKRENFLKIKEGNYDD